MATPHVKTFTELPQDIAAVANKYIVDQRAKGLEASRIEFGAKGCTDFRMFIALKFRKGTTLSVVSVTDIEQNWGGDASANHPVISIFDKLWYCGVDKK